MPRHSCLLLSVLLIVAATISVGAQRFRSGTIGVRVDVLVTNGGRLVRGLAADDFELRDDGVVQSVSEVELEQIPAVLEAAKRTDAVVYAVAIPQQLRTVTTFSRGGSTSVTRTQMTEVNNAGKFLNSLTEETGGRVLFASSNRDLRSTFIQTLAEFRDRYVLSYAPAGVAPTGWHRLEVKLKGKSGKVTARRGYFAE